MVGMGFATFVQLWAWTGPRADTLELQEKLRIGSAMDLTPFWKLRKSHGARAYATQSYKKVVKKLRNRSKSYGNYMDPGLVQPRVTKKLQKSYGIGPKVTEITWTPGLCNPELQKSCQKVAELIQKLRKLHGPPYLRNPYI